MQVGEVQCAKIILAEDNADDEALAIRALRKTGVPIAVQVAHDGDRALELLGLKEGGDDTPSLPRLVVLDVKMPKVGGIEVLRRIREDKRFDDVPVVMLTSSDEPVDVELCRKLGASSYIKKPVDYDEFVSTIAEVARHWLTGDQGIIAKLSSCLFTLAGIL